MRMGRRSQASKSMQRAALRGAAGGDVGASRVEGAE